MSNGVFVCGMCGDTVQDSGHNCGWTFSEAGDLGDGVHCGQVQSRPFAVMRKGSSEEIRNLPKHLPHLPEVEYYRRSIAGTLVEAKDVIAAWGLTYHIGTAVAYLLRAGKKTADAAQDISKAHDHLLFELERLKAEGKH
jgi:hypothetical protein